MKRLAKTLIILSLLFLPVNHVLADEYDDLQKEKEQKLQEKQAKEEEKERAQQQQQSIGNQLAAVGEQLTVISDQLERKKAEIAQLEKDKEETQAAQRQKETQRNALWRTLYKQSRLNSLELFFGADSFAKLGQIWGYFEATVGASRQNLQTLSLQINDLTKNILSAGEREAQLEGEVAGLESERQNLSARHSQLTSYQNNLLNQITGLEGEIQNITAKQEELIRQKLAATAFFTSVGDIERSLEALPDPPFSPAFAVFSYGYPHRVGMNQYGAYGRAKAGQNAQEILKTYYKDVEIVDFAVPSTIRVDGFGEVPFEDNYLKGIAEMPNGWGDSGALEALKAQAIAARTYALAVTDNGRGSICPTQSCQVYNPGKVGSSRAGNWHKAVEETRGKIITHGGAPIKAWYSSTDGGYTRLATDFDVRWNASPPYIQRLKDADGEGRPFDGPGHGDSPWFHRAWYDQTTDEHPWLTKEEMRDLFNVSLLPEKYNEFLSQETPVTSAEPGWSKEKVRETLAEEGIAPIEDFSEIKVAFADEGYTALIRVSTPAGSRDIDGRRFRQIFSLRSRGRLALWSSLYDIVQK